VGICIVILYFFRIIFYIYWDYIFIFFCLTAFPVGRSKRIPDFDDMLIDFSSLCQPPNNQRLLNIFIFKCWSLFFRLLTFFTHITAEPLSVVNLFNSLFFQQKILHKIFIYINYSFPLTAARESLKSRPFSTLKRPGKVIFLPNATTDLSGFTIL